MSDPGRVAKLLGTELPIFQAPMAGAQDSALAIAVCEAGGLGSLPCAMIALEKVREEIAAIRQRTSRPFCLNFFCHRQPAPDPEREAAWKAKLTPYYLELGLDPEAAQNPPSRQPFDEAACELVEDLKPPVVSFHFGLPDADLLDRVRATGATVMSSATTVAEARWLEDRGCDIVIAQGVEAGGHRGCFLTRDMAAQVGTLALVPQIVDAVKVPVVATGGIMEARGVEAALALGASAVQLGTAYLFCPEARVHPTYLRALREAGDDSTAITNVFSGRPARGIVNRLIREVGPLSADAPDFPRTSIAIAPLRAASEAAGSYDFAQMWAGQGVGMRREMPAADLTRLLAAGLTA